VKRSNPDNLEVCDMRARVFTVILFGTDWRKLVTNL
jgi:hypothetical protein